MKESELGKPEFASPDLTRPLIGAAFEVHKHLGFGYLESVYVNALLIELRKPQIRSLDTGVR